MSIQTNPACPLGAGVPHQHRHGCQVNQVDFPIPVKVTPKAVASKEVSRKKGKVYQINCQVGVDVRAIGHNGW